MLRITHKLTSMLSISSRAILKPTIITRYNSSLALGLNKTKWKPNSIFTVSQRSVADSIPKVDSSSELDQQAKGTKIDATNVMTQLERIVSRFDDRCIFSELAQEEEFVKTFNFFTKSVSQLEEINALDNDDVKTNLSICGGRLLASCGNLMADTPKKVRELLAGNLWTFIKEKKIPLAITHYNTLLKVLNENDVKVDPQKMIDEILAGSLTLDRVTYQRLIHQYCMQGDINGATNLLEKMKKSEMELTEATFASLILGYSKQDNVMTSPIDIFELMKTNNIEPGNQSFAAAIISLVSSMQHPEHTTKAKEEMEKVVQLLKQEQIQFKPQQLAELFEASSPVKDEPLVVQLRAYLKGQRLKSLNEFRTVYNALLKTGSFEEVSELFWNTNRISGRDRGIFYLKLLAKHKNIPVETVIKEAYKYKEQGNNLKVFQFMYYSAAEVGNLNLVRASLKEISQEEEIKCQYLWPLLAQSNDEAELIKVLKEDFNPKMDLNDLIDTFSQWVWPRFSEDVSKLFKLNKNELHYDNNVLITSYLSYSVAENKLADALEFIRGAPEDLISSSTKNEKNEQDEEGNSLLLPSKGIGTKRNVIIGRILEQISQQTNDVAVLEKLYNLCQVQGEQVSMSSSPIIRSRLMAGNFEAALELFIEICEKNRITPCKNELMSHCIKKGDEESLEKIMKLSVDIHGESNSTFDLICTYLSCGDAKKAQQIADNRTFRVNPSRIYREARLRLRLSQIQVLENLVFLMRNMYDVNQEVLYSILIEAYDKTSDGKRALALWNKMQEEDLQPSQKVLVMIAEVLERNNIAVPFQVMKRARKSRDIHEVR